MQAEQDLVVVIFAMDRILADVVQRVVHPAHVPFVAEAKPAEFDGARHLRPCGGFLRGGRSVRKFREHFGVEAAQEFDRFDILTTAIFVRNPASGRAAVIEIEHGGYGIDAQAIDAVALQPEQCVRHQEVGHFRASIIVDQCAPIEVAALQRVGVFVKRGAVEIAETMAVVGEVPRHPVEQQREAFRMTGLDERREIIRRAEAARRRKQAGRLIAPRSVERVFADRQQFDMGEAHVARVFR